MANEGIAFYSTADINLMKASLGLPSWVDELLELRPPPRRYHSNWRALHVDGFEDGFVQFIPMHYRFTVGVAPPSAFEHGLPR